MFGAGLGLKPRLEPQDLMYNPDDADGVRESARALTAIRKKYGRAAAFVHHPMVEVLVDRAVMNPAFRTASSLDTTQDRYRRLVADFLRAAAASEIRLSMRRRCYLWCLIEEVSDWKLYLARQSSERRGTACVCEEPSRRRLRHSAACDALE